MKDYGEHASRLVKQATDILFAKNPVGTSMGAFGGAASHGFLGLFSSKLSSLNIFYFVAAGIFLFNLRFWLKQENNNSEAEGKIKFIEQQERKGNITREQAKIQYQRVVTEAVDNARLDDLEKQKSQSTS